MKQLYIETYGCQMNFADSEVVASILSDEYRLCQTAQEADVILLNTCSIRENAEQRVLKRLEELRALRKKGKSLKIGLIGCMASRYQDNWVESHLHRRTRLLPLPARNTLRRGGTANPHRTLHR